MIVARRLGEEGFVVFLQELHWLGVLQHAELLAWLSLHGAVLRAIEPPLDDGETFHEERISDLWERLR